MRLTKKKNRHLAMTVRTGIYGLNNAPQFGNMLL